MAHADVVIDSTQLPVQGYRLKAETHQQVEAARQGLGRKCLTVLVS